MPVHRLLVAALALVASACTIQTVASDAGASDAATQTVGDQCAVIAREFCQEGANRCLIGIGTPLDQCISALVARCCVGSMCNAKSQSPASAVTACQQSIDAEDCNSIQNGVSPDACVGIPKMP